MFHAMTAGRVQMQRALVLLAVLIFSICSVDTAFSQTQVELISLEGPVRLAKAQDRGLCRSMIPKGHRPNAIDTRALGKSLDDDWVGPKYLSSKHENPRFFEVEDIDLLNDGSPQRVFQFSTGATFPSYFFVITPTTVKVDDVYAALQDKQLDEVPKFALARGWKVMQWDPRFENPYENFYYRVYRAETATYLLGLTQSANTDIQAVLWKGRPDGTLQAICVFKGVDHARNRTHERQ